MSLSKSLSVPALLSVSVSLILWSEFLYSGSIKHSFVLFSCNYIIPFSCCVVFFFLWMYHHWFAHMAFDGRAFPLRVSTNEVCYEQSRASLSVKNTVVLLLDQTRRVAQTSTFILETTSWLCRGLCHLSPSVQDCRVPAAALLTRIGFQLPFPAHLLSGMPPSFLVLVFQMRYLFGEI